MLGPNCCIYCRSADVPAILALVETYFPCEEPPTDGKGFCRGRTTSAPPATALSPEARAAIAVSCTLVLQFLFPKQLNLIRLSG